MTNEELEQATEKIYTKIKNIPGVDRNFVKKCLFGISSLGDKDVDNRIELLLRLL